MATNTITELHYEIAKQGNQSLYYQWITEVGNANAPHAKPLKVKIEIKSDSHKFQSYARGYVWSSLSMQWNLVAELYQMNTETGLAYRDESEWTAEAFIADADELHALVLAVAK